MIEELGKWMLDISKYIITAYVLVRMFGKEDDSVWTLVSAILLATLLFGMGLYLVKRGKENLKKKGKKYGLRIIRNVYIFGFNSYRLFCLCQNRRQKTET